MGKADKITARQLTVLIFMGLLSPMIRILPTAAAEFGHRAAWLSPIAAVVGGSLFLALIRALTKNAPEGQGLADMALSGLGPVLGRIFCLFCALWLTFYAGFVSRSAAERLLATVYPHGNTPVFVVVMLLAAVIASSGFVKSLTRTAEVLMPILGAVIAVVLLSALTDVSGENLLPVTYRDGAELLYGAIPVFNVMTVFAYFIFLRGYVTKPEGQRDRPFPWLTALATTAFFVTLVTMGTLGDKLSVTMENGFFMVIRNIKILGVVERIEAVVVAIWIVTDFIFLAGLFTVISQIWKTVTGAKKRRIFVLPSAILAGAAAFLIASNAFTFQRWSDYLIPAANMAVTVLMIPLVLAVGKLRKKY